MVDFYTGILCSQSGAKKIRTTIRLHTKERERRRTVNASRRVVVESACALLFAARARSFFFFFFFFLRCSKTHSFKVSSFFSSLLERVKFRVPCVVVFVVVGLRFRHQNCSCCLFASQSKWFLKCLLWEKMRFIMGETTAMVLSKKKKKL